MTHFMNLNAPFPSRPLLHQYTPDKVASLRNQTRQAFLHAYDGYLQNAYPMDELCPITCTGTNEFFKGKMALTLIDSLDSLVVFGLDHEFRHAVDLVAADVHFRHDVNVSTFETNIRVLGGLLSAHLLAVDESTGMYLYDMSYDNQLLDLAYDLGGRLLPAFDTPTGIPYGTINLLHGVPPGETPVTCTAGGGTFLLEFAALSRLTGDSRFEDVARHASAALFQRRDVRTGLVGSHINILTGEWINKLSGVGSFVDSYYEYLFKYWQLFDGEEELMMFVHSYWSVMRHVKAGAWYFEVHMTTGDVILPVVGALQGFWPGLQALFGDVKEAAESMIHFMSLWAKYDGIPDRYNLRQGKPEPDGEAYVLRPELLESAFWLQSVAPSDFWLEVGTIIGNMLEQRSRVKCGYANIKDVTTHEVDDHMESFFLSETLKYMFLLFGGDVRGGARETDLGSNGPRPGSLASNKTAPDSQHEWISRPWNHSAETNHSGGVGRTNHTVQDGVHDVPGPGGPTRPTGVRKFPVTTKWSDMFTFTTEAHLLPLRLDPSRHRVDSKTIKRWNRQLKVGRLTRHSVSVFEDVVPHYRTCPNFAHTQKHYALTMQSCDATRSMHFNETAYARLSNEMNIQFPIREVRKRPVNRSIKHLVLSVWSGFVDTVDDFIRNYVQSSNGWENVAHILEEDLALAVLLVQLVLIYLYR